VQNLVVLEAVQQRGRRAVRIAGEEHRGARHALRRLLLQHGDEGESSGVSSLRVLSINRRVPRRQVYMTTITPPASASGTQPPSTTFMRLAARKVVSTMMKGAIRAMVAASDQCQTLRMTMNAMIAVTTMVPVTAMP